MEVHVCVGVGVVAPEAIETQQTSPMEHWPGRQPMYQDMHPESGSHELSTPASTYPLLSRFSKKVQPVASEHAAAIKRMARPGTRTMGVLKTCSSR
jgi:hypothetical protein